MTTDFTEEELRSLTGIAPVGEEKQNVHTFLHNVAVAKDTTKTGNLSEQETGTPKLPLRTHKELELFCRDIMNQKEFADYFKKKAEILTSTSLSKDAKLISLAVVQERKISSIAGVRKKNKGWFTPKDRRPEQVQTIQTEES